jgi:hypothetical protein
MAVTVSTPLSTVDDLLTQTTDPERCSRFDSTLYVRDVSGAGRVRAAT